MSVRSNSLAVLFRSSVSSLKLCFLLPLLSRGVRFSSCVGLCVSPFRSVIFLYVYFDALLLDAHAFKIMFSLLTDTFVVMKCLIILFVLKSTLCDVNIATPAILLKVCMAYFFNCFTSKLLPSLYLKPVY